MTWPLSVDQLVTNIKESTIFERRNKKCGALHDLVPSAQFRKREKHPWRSVNFSKACNFTKINTPPWVLFTFFKLCTWY